MGIRQMGMGFLSCLSDGHNSSKDMASILPQGVLAVASIAKQLKGNLHHSHHRNRRSKKQRQQSSK
jgi:hypothetical protein